MLRVVCGTAFNLSFWISLPVSLQIPYVLFSIRTKAASKLSINFFCLAANWLVCSFSSVAEPSSKVLYVPAVSSVPFALLLLRVLLSIVNSSLAIRRFSRIIALNSWSSESLYRVFSILLMIKPSLVLPLFPYRQSLCCRYSLIYRILRNRLKFHCKYTINYLLSHLATPYLLLSLH